MGARGTVSSETGKFRKRNQLVTMSVARVTTDANPLLPSTSPRRVYSSPHIASRATTASYLSRLASFFFARNPPRNYRPIIPLLRSFQLKTLRVLWLQLHTISTLLCLRTVILQRNRTILVPQYFQTLLIRYVSLKPHRHKFLTFTSLGRPPQL